MSVRNLTNNTADFMYAERRDFYLRDRITKELYPTHAPFTTVAARSSMRPVYDPDYKGFEHRHGWLDQRFVINEPAGVAWTVPGGSVAGAPSATVDVAIDTAAMSGFGLMTSIGTWALNMMVEVWTSAKVYKGVAIITAVNEGANELTLKSLGNPADPTNKAIGAITQDDNLVVISNAHGEGTHAPDAHHDELSTIFNSCQIFRTPVELTATAAKVQRLRGDSNEERRLIETKGMEHKMHKEKAFLFGLRSGGIGHNAMSVDKFGGTGVGNGHQLDDDGKIIRTTMGVVPALRQYGVSDPTNDQQNLFTMSKATATYDDFITNIEKVTQYLPMHNQGRLYAFASRPWLSFLSSTAIQKNSGWDIQISGEVKHEFGFQTREIITTHGTLVLVPTPILRKEYSQTMLLINPDCVELRKFREERFKQNIKIDDGYDGRKHEYFSDEGLYLDLLETHSMWTLAA